MIGSGCRNSPSSAGRTSLILTAGAIALLGLGGCETGSSKGDFVDLFDGKSTKGWIKPFDWGKATVEDKAILLHSDGKMFFLVTEKTYRDFVLEVEVLLPDNGNSGIQFRSHYKQNKLRGYQAEVDPSERRWSGGFYDEGRRGWLVNLKGKDKAQAAFKNGQWNHYRIEAVGDHIQIFVNGIQTVDTYDQEDSEGHIALQHHGEAGLVYRFRNVRIEELSPQ